MSTGGSRGWAEPGAWPYYRAERDVWLGHPGYARSRTYDPSIACDGFGRCWRRDPFDRYERDYSRRREAQPPGWAERLPESSPTRKRFVQPRSDVVCDQATRICYKEGEIDKTDTKAVFGERAADRADDVRDRHGTARVFVPERGVSCDRESRRCFEDGDPDRRLTKRYFGRRAARNLD